MKSLILAFSFFVAASAQADTYRIRLFDSSWVVNTDTTAAGPVAATFYGVTLKQTDGEGRETGPAYFLASNNNGWGDNALNLVCEQLLDGKYPYAGGGKSTHSGIFAKDVLVIIGDSNQEGRAVDYKLSDTNETTVFSRDLTCYESEEQANDSYE